MGEAVYYAKAVWLSKEEAEEAAPKVNAFLYRLAECEERWQELRPPMSNEETPNLPEELAELDKQIKELETQKRYEEAREKSLEFSKRGDAILRQEFPDIFEALEISPPEREQDWHSLNYLAGKLDSPANDPEWDFQVVDDTILFAGTVWHFAQWESLMIALRDRFGAISTGYISDEWVGDLYDMIPMEEA